MVPAIKLMSPKILVRPAPRIEKNQSGIIIPVTVNQALEQATVILVADGVKVLKEGDVILYPRGAGVVQEIDQVDYKFLSGPTETEAGEVWAVI